MNWEYNYRREWDFIHFWLETETVVSVKSKLETETNISVKGKPETETLI